MPDGSVITILLADDHEDDRLMTRDALRDARLHDDLRFVIDGVDLLDYLHRRGRHADPASSPRPVKVFTRYWLEIVDLPPERELA